MKNYLENILMEIWEINIFFNNAINNIIFLCSEMTSCLINDDENNINFYVEKIQKYSNYKLWIKISKWLANNEKAVEDCFSKTEKGIIVYEYFW